MRRVRVRNSLQCNRAGRGPGSRTATTQPFRFAPFDPVEKAREAIPGEGDILGEEDETDRQHPGNKRRNGQECNADDHEQNARRQADPTDGRLSQPMDGSAQPSRQLCGEPLNPRIPPSRPVSESVRMTSACRPRVAFGHYHERFGPHVESRNESLIPQHQQGNASADHRFGHGPTYGGGTNAAGAFRSRREFRPPKTGRWGRPRPGERGRPAASRGRKAGAE